MAASDELAPEGLFGLLQGPALERLTRRSVSRGEKLITEGSAAEALYLIETGRFRVERAGVELAEIGAGSVLGEIAFLTGEPRTADVVAAREAVVLEISRSDFDALCGETPGLAAAIATELARRLSKTSARVAPDPGRPLARTYCLVPAGERPIQPRFLRELTTAIGHHRTLRVIGEAELQDALGADTDPTSPDAIAWMNRQEREADLVLFLADPKATPWSLTTLRQADQAVFIADAQAFAAPSRLERAALDLLTENQRRLVLLHPQRLQRTTGTGRWLDTRPAFMHHHVALLDDGEDIARLARFLSGRAVGLVMSGGGAFGVAHVGVWRAMREAGLPIDIVGGTSIGSAMAGAIALGVPPADIGPRVEEIFVTSGAMRRMTIPKYSFLDHTVLDAALKTHFGTEPIEDLWLPYYAVVADLAAMQKRVVRRGPLWEAIRASSAIPGVLPAFYTADGAMLVDGGCIDNMPIRDMHALKAGPNVVVNVQKETGQEVKVDYDALPGRNALIKRMVLPFGKEMPRAPGVVSTVMRSLLIGQGAFMNALNETDLHIRPPGLKGPGFLAWSEHEHFYELGYKFARENLADLRYTSHPAKAALRRAAGFDEE